MNNLKMLKTHLILPDYQEKYNYCYKHSELSKTFKRNIFLSVNSGKQNKIREDDFAEVSV